MIYLAQRQCSDCKLLSATVRWELIWLLDFVSVFELCPDVGFTLTCSSMGYVYLSAYNKGALPPCGPYLSESESYCT